jgi:hypothetical protein
MYEPLYKLYCKLRGSGHFHFVQICLQIKPLVALFRDAPRALAHMRTHKQTTPTRARVHTRSNTVLHAPRDGPGSVSSRCMHLLTTSVSPSCSSTISAMWAERRFGMGVGMGPGTGRTECESSRVSYVACAACVRNGTGVPFKVRNFVQKLYKLSTA